MVVADGLKTGFIKESGYGLVGSAKQNGQRLIVVVNGLKSEKERADESKKLLEWGFNSFQTNFLFAEGALVAEAKVYGGDQRYVPLLSPRDVKLMVPRNAPGRIAARVVYAGPVPAPVQKGQKIGRLKVWRGDSVVLEVGGKPQVLPNDYVWIFAGGEPPMAFLKKIGIGFGVQDLTSAGALEIKDAKEGTVVLA